jgi:UDPglucose--hexose-1-phosphate uridylyltransferase
VRERLAALTAHRAATGRCLTCAVVARDDAAPERTLARGAAFAVTVPFAPRWPYEVHIRAVHHGVRRLGDLTAAAAAELAEALRAAVQRYDGLFGFPLPYMMVVQEAPTTASGPAEDHHLAVELLPPHRSERKLKVRASVETAAGLFINDTLPEDSAARLAAVRLPPSSGAVVVPDVVAVPANHSPRSRT